MAKCVLYDRECINCFECDERCELDVNKICDNCFKCLETTENYKTIKITNIIKENE